MKGKTILVPVDFSDASRAGLEYAIELAKPLKATLIVLFAVEPLYYAGDMGLLLEEEQRIGKEQLARVTAGLERRNVPFRALMRIGPAHQVIAQVAETVKADLIVMSTHGRSGLAHALLGSVAEKVARTATCPVLTVRVRRQARSARPALAAVGEKTRGARARRHT